MRLFRCLAASLGYRVIEVPDVGELFDVQAFLKSIPPPEKNQAREGWINGGFMVFEPRVFEYFRDDQTSLESDVLEQLAADRQLAAYRHPGFWQCMDTLRDKRLLEKMWADGSAPWRVWE